MKRTLTDPSIYAGLAYLLSGAPLGLIWFVVLVTLWSLCLGLVITPFVIPVAIALAFVTRGFATVEAELVRSLLGVEAHAPASPTAVATGFWARLRAMFGGSFWRAQTYLLIRWLAGFPLGVASFAVIAAALGMIFAPLWVPFVDGGAHLGFWSPHTFAQALVLVPIGLVLLPVTIVASSLVGRAFGPLASALLRGEDAIAPAPRAAAVPSSQRPRATTPRQALAIHATVDAVVVLGLVLIWALTSRGYFWPIWVVLPLGMALAIHRWFVALDEDPAITDRFRGSRTLAGATGVSAAVSLFLIAVWAITGHGYFWPVWAMLGIGIVLAALTGAALLSSPDHTQMAERIETLESTRAGAVDLQDSELRRIERDLHDGAQARLVALGMSLGMAEQRLSEDPERAGELLAEARVGAEHALRELRDLARGIHPPVLADRGLDAALTSLASTTPMPVSVSVELPARPPAAVETAAYFVAAEALANAAKHARATHVEIRIRNTNEILELEVDDDGCGGADPNGTGLLGMRRRVEALDGTLTVSSPAGGPTRIHAELPCGS